jgi:hypothetical protein
LFVVRDTPEYEVKDYFADSTGNERMIFMFVEVSELDPDYIEDVGYSLVQNHPILYFDCDTLQYVCVGYFYRPGTARPLTGDMSDRIKEDYPDKTGIEHRINYVTDAYIYTASLRKKFGKTISIDTLIKSPILIPGPGVKAKDVFKKVDESAGKSKTAADTTKTRNDSEE